VARAAIGPADPAWAERERAILTAVDQLVVDHDLDDAAWDALAVHLDERRRIELIVLVGHYEMLATTIAALRVEPDRRRG
jgi:alkylhydroperoxidase family enzyme